MVTRVRLADRIGTQKDYTTYIAVIEVVDANDSLFSLSLSFFFDF